MDGGEAILRQTRVEVVREGMVIAVPAGELLYGVVPGDTVRVSAAIDYRGPALDDNFYAAIGNQLVYFDEVWPSGLVPVHFDASVDLVSYLLTADIPITEIGIAPWTPGWFDLYVKINGHPGAGKPLLTNVIEVLLKPEFQNFGIVSYDVV